MYDPSALPKYEGVVVHGDKRGRVLGFPTANIAIGPGATPPADGVYCCVVRVPPAGTLHGATGSVGTNPTFVGITATRIEVFIHDFDATLYGLGIELYLVQRLRGMQRFDGVAALIEQTRRDVAASRVLLDALPLP